MFSVEVKEICGTVEYVAIFKLWTVVNMGLHDYKEDHAEIWYDREVEVMAIPSHLLF